MEDQSKSSNMTFESTNDFKSQGSMTDAIVMMSAQWTKKRLIFLLQCCAHHDDGDSLGMNDDLVHQMLKKGENQSPDKDNKNRPKQQTSKTTKQNTGSPPKRETVKQAVSEWTRLSVLLFRQVVPLYSQTHYSHHIKCLNFEPLKRGHLSFVFW